jgi:UDP-N-acetyl-D-mannosaminuronic acid dehydrogenase
MYKKVVVIGMGYIGFPTALLFARAGYKVVGIEKILDKLEKIRNGDYNKEEQNLNEIFKQVKDNIKFSSEIEEADIFVVCTQTPLTKDKRVDMTYIYNAIEEIATKIKQDDLVIIESTLPVGETRKIFDYLSKKSMLNGKFYLAHCPETAFPTDLLNEMINNSKIIGGVNEKSTKLAAELYSKIIKGKIIETNSSISELAKLVQNIYRDVNIAFANELSIICDKLNVNVFEVIKLANLHPRVKIHNPSAGVGGSCIPIDAYFISNYVDGCDLIKKAREINNYKPIYISKKVKGKKIGILGVTYKSNISDTRLSQAEIIIKELMKDHKVLVYDPYTSETFGGERANIQQILDCDEIVIVTPHDEFKKYIEELKKKNVIDPTNFLETK